MPEILKRIVERAIESGANRIAEGPEPRNLVQELKLPKEVLHYLYAQIDETKNGLYRVVARSLARRARADPVRRRAHQGADQAEGFEIKTEIPLHPERRGDAPRAKGRRGSSAEPERRDSNLTKPEVVAVVRMKDKTKDRGPAPVTTATTTKEAERAARSTPITARISSACTHRIIAMVGDVVKKVECKTCNSHHLYRRPKTERDAAHAQMEKRAADRAASGPPRTVAGKAAPAAKAERLQVAQWNCAIAGQPVNAFKAYRVSRSPSAKASSSAAVRRRRGGARHRPRQGRDPLQGRPPHDGARPGVKGLGR